MKLAITGIIPPKQWYHKPEIKTKDDNWTTAMCISYYCKQVPE